MKLLSSAVVLFLVLGSALAYKSYSGYQVLKTAPLTAAAMPYINRMSQRFDFWGTPGVGRPATVMVSPEEAPVVVAAFNRMRVAHEVLVADLGPQVENQRAEREALKVSSPSKPRTASYDRFMEFVEIDAHIHETADGNPAIASVLDLGFSYGGLEFHGLKLSNGQPGQKAVWFDCAIHAREWLSTPVCLRIIDEVLADPALRDLADWYIMPVANPDGYDYSFTDDRFWRKTRRPTADANCPGTDPNRNFDFLWDAGNPTDYCSEVYPGTGAFSEPEVAAMGNFILDIADNLVLYVAVHSYGEMILYPYGHTVEPVPNVDQLIAAGTASADAIAAVAGTAYTVENSASGLYFTYGASDDFAYGRGAVEFAYTFELSAGGSGGFDPPASQIQPTVDEVWPGMLALVEYVLAN
ncbi:carboxypeptidase B-like [Cloeon dipterum]|uniref:carboxypeptidase B-like n=1 Tax=Cloeon dipterum TaxID=197152 RepID=UPI00321F7E83